MRPEARTAVKGLPRQPDTREAPAGSSFCLSMAVWRSFSLVRPLTSFVMGLRQKRADHSGRAQRTPPGQPSWEPLREEAGGGAPIRRAPGAGRAANERPHTREARAGALGRWAAGAPGPWGAAGALGRWGARALGRWGAGALGRKLGKASWKRLRGRAGRGGWERRLGRRLWRRRLGEGKESAREAAKRKGQKLKAPGAR